VPSHCSLDAAELKRPEVNRKRQRVRERQLPEYVGSARFDTSEPIQDDEQAQAKLASDLSEACNDTIPSHSDDI
jgi:hypothetical protein